MGFQTDTFRNENFKELKAPGFWYLLSDQTGPPRLSSRLEIREFLFQIRSVDNDLTHHGCRRFNFVDTNPRMYQMQNDQLRKYFRRTTTKLTFTTMRMHYTQRGGTSCRYFRLVSQIAIAIAILTFPSAEARWNATGTVRNLWATPIMEYSGLFSDEQLAAFATDVKTSWANFLKERSDPNRKQKVVTKSQAFGTSTKNDKDKINEEFFNYQSRNPINQATLETVWQGFVYACNRFVEETGLPPIEYQRETLAGGSIEWTTDKGPRRGNQYCWGSVQFGGTHHDVHTHPGSALAGTLYLEVPPDGGALSLSDPRGPMPPFNYAYRVLPEAGKYIIFPGTLPHAVHATPGEMPRVSISCNHPGDWKKFTTSKVVWGESTFSHEMMSREEHEAAAKAKSQQ